MDRRNQNILFILLILFECRGILCDKCTYLINELNPANPDQPEANEYFEILFVCPFNQQPDFTGRKLILIKALTDSVRNQAVIQMYAEFKAVTYRRKPANGRYFYLFASGNLVRFDPETQTTRTIVPDVTYTDPQIYSRTKIETPVPHAFRPKNRINNVNHIPYALVALEIPSGEIVEIQNILRRCRDHSVPLTDQLAQRLQKYVVDAVVYARGTPLTKCTVFNDLMLPLKHYDDYVQCAWDGNDADYSINRCAPNNQPFEVKAMGILLR